MARAAAGAVGIKEAVMHPPIATLVGSTRGPWNKGQLIGQKRPLKPKEVWAIRVRLQLERHDQAAWPASMGLPTRKNLVALIKRGHLNEI